MDGSNTQYILMKLYGKIDFPNHVKIKTLFFYLPAYSLQPTPNGSLLPKIGRARPAMFARRALETGGVPCAAVLWARLCAVPCALHACAAT